MKKLILMIAAVLTLGVVQAQIFDPVKWTFAAKKTGEEDVVLFLKATIDNGWNIYSQHVGDGGPVPTSFSFTPSSDYQLVGKVLEPTPNKKFEKTFDMQVLYFSKEVVFQQKIKLKKGQTVIKGAVEFMVCNDKQCLPPDEKTFAITVK
ncbi:protein-disulfide reductase DsbD domain-containing protein [Sphingobacterium chuzhouense]|uniref:Protein-disulfide reductase DsbD N-terminal domain-containing protein n=1 Tax=Sphingobacterium chuzhouense TaxID=1742264 RepID=A0ABR7XSZ1_9SPHI|nr:protein-disulfide reductase DsbD domain-containing protein [Sphingobacterium chuzhouense]MBD1422293.1 protein-disulfide reductase DsbD N-terminal domain-containing protein [Sphingobacterium chuzhouense]